MKKITAILITALVLCCFVGIASASTAVTEEMVTNGNFSNELTGWTSQTHNGNGVVGLSTTTVDSKSCLQFSFQTPISSGDDPYAYVEQTVDLTNVDTLYWKTKKGYTSYTTSSDFWALYIYQNGNRIASYTYGNLGDSWTQRSYNVSSITGEVTLRFYGSIDTRSTSSAYLISFYVTDISAISTTYPATVSDVYYTKTGTANTGCAYSVDESVSVHYSVDIGSEYNASAIIYWGDGSSTTSSQGSGSGTLTHTYSEAGSYTPYICPIIYWSDGSYQVLVDKIAYLSTIYVCAVDFSADTTSADPGTYITFTPSATIPSDTSISSYLWNFGDGSTSTNSVPTHLYSNSGTYSVSLKVTLSQGSGYNLTVTKSNYINTADQTVTFNVTTVASGSQVKASWSLRETNYPYILNVYPSSNTGERTSYTAIATHTINSASDTSYTFTVGSAGYYSAYLEKSGNQVTRTTSPVNVYTVISLSVNVANNGAPYITEQTTVNLYNTSGTLLQTKQTVLQSSGSYSDSVIFSDIRTGEYYVTISANNASSRTSPTLTLTDSYTLTMDFTLGSSDSSSTGSGSQYASTFVTFRTQDSGTGRYVSGVQIVASAVEPTNAWEYFANLFGASLGEVIQAMTLSGTSDYDGRITFAMYPNVRYSLNITYNQNGKNYQETRSFQQSTLTGEYLISIPITDTSSEKITENLVTQVNTSGESIITNFTDYSGTVSKCVITVYKKNGDERENLNMSIVYDNPVKGVPQLQTFTPTDASGNSYIVSFVMTSSTFGNKTQEYGVTFSGVAVKLGDIPNDWYIWISFAILLMTGAVATFVNSRHFAIVLCIVATLLYFAGWLSALGTVAPIAIIICYVLTIVYYIANHNGGA